MNYQIDRFTSKPAYLQLYEQVKEDVLNGFYPYHSKLPSKRTVALEVGVSTITVEHAYALLCDEGYVEARERSGYLVIFRQSDGFASTANPILPQSKPISRTHQISTNFSSATLSKIMRRVISEHQDRLLEKSPNTGRLELREAIRRYLARNRGIYTQVEQIIIGSGSEYLYGLITELLGRDRTFAIESPSYKKIEQVYRASELRYELLPLTQDGISSTALAATQASVLHTTPYRSFPSGVTASASKRHEYVRWASTESRYIVEDDFESEFSISSKPEETLFSLSECDNVIYMNTFSKTISPALRVGYMVLPLHLVKPFEEKLGFYSCTVPTFEQFLLTELISNGDFERHINRIRRQKRKELQG